MRWFWRKRAEGFEWRDYVRTTILVRRNERRQKVEDARQAAIFGVKQAAHKGAEAGVAGADALGRVGKAAGAALGRGGRAAGVALGRRGLAAGAAAARGSAAAARAVGHGAAVGGRAVGRASIAGFERVREAARPHLEHAGDVAYDKFEPLLDALLRPGIVMPLAIAGVVAAVGGAVRAWNFGIDGQVLFAWSIAFVAALLYLVPRLVAGEAPFAKPGGALARLAALPGLDRVSGRGLASVIAAILTLFGGYVAWINWPENGLQPLLTSSPSPGESKSDPPSVAVTRLPEIKGRGSAVSGDTLKVSGTILKLAGIEAPESNQRCSGASERRGQCAAAAREALARSVRARALVCRLGSEDEQGTRLATCHDGDKDIAAELVRAGHVFAVPGFFARYGGAEAEARSARAGVWQGEDVERPAEFRAKLWEEAKRNAPEGCPIKGRVASGSRTYVLPWSPAYDRIRVRESRGERWFCSEQQARAAGWRPI